jgi:hypothetical protein
MVRREVRDACSVSPKHDVRQDDEGTGMLSAHGRERLVEGIGSPCLEGARPHPQRPRRDLRLLHEERVLDVGGVPEDSHPGDLGDGLLEQLESLARGPPHEVASSSSRAFASVRSGAHSREGEKSAAYQR